MDFLENNSIETLENLKRDVNQMLQWTDKEIYEFYEEDVSGGLRLDTPDKARAWLEKLRQFLEEHKK